MERDSPDVSGMLFLKDLMTIIKPTCHSRVSMKKTIVSFTLSRRSRIPLSTRSIGFKKMSMEDLVEMNKMKEGVLLFSCKTDIPS